MDTDLSGYYGRELRGAADITSQWSHREILQVDGASGQQEATSNLVLTED